LTSNSKEGGYDYDNILDTEYLISVLNPAFKDDPSTLIDNNNYGLEVFDTKVANMFLAEDRILCLEIFAKKGYSFRLK